MILIWVKNKNSNLANNLNLKMKMYKTRKNNLEKEILKN